MKTDTTKKLSVTFTQEMAEKIVRCAGPREADGIIARISHIAYCKGINVGRGVPLDKALKDMRTAEHWSEYFIDKFMPSDISDNYRKTVIDWIRRIQQDALGKEIDRAD